MCIRDRYKKLRTQAFVFSSTKCTNCDNPLTMPSVHFLCGHSFIDTCLLSDKGEKECIRCLFENQRIIDTYEQLKRSCENAKVFQENLNQSKDKFDTITDLLGKGLINFSKD
eukprot:TRINITY_DN3927_c0_g1_i3.p1 TRINITY_DN3927_c0_g1~~TRINITY_DN3927_c0_g1_i3.p1  ORF type:complete len:112 (+),score=8.58 TRINITY_DN3927_c0_g1_i3:68-403(+)